MSFSNGATQISGQLFDRLRPLTLRNKSIVEDFARYYADLRQIDGQSGFNYPDIHAHFSSLALAAIDNPESVHGPYERAREFIQDAKCYKPIIHGIRLFREGRMSKPETTNIHISGNDIDGWKWKVTWREGSYDEGTESSFIHAQSEVFAVMQRGEQSL